MTVKQWFGTYPAQVYSTADPQKTQRVQLKVPQVLGQAVSQWAVPLSAGVKAPAPGTAVTAVFLGGDPSHPAYFTTLTNPEFTGNVTIDGNLTIDGSIGAPSSLPITVGGTTYATIGGGFVRFPGPGVNRVSIDTNGNLLLVNNAAGSSSLSANANGNAQVTTNAGLTGTIPAVQTDVTQYPVAVTGLTQASKAWNIPLGDPKAGTIYRLTNWGYFNVTSASNAPTWSIAVAGINQAVFSSSGFVVGQLIYRLVTEVIILTTGISGTMSVYCEIQFSVPNSADDQSWTNGNASLAINTTVNNTLEVQYGWGNITSSPTFFSTASMLERVGP